jgi:hypothetical protein
MSDELEPIRQNIEINVTDKGVNESEKDLSKLDATITGTTESTKKLTDSNKKQEESFKPLKVQLREARELLQRMSAQYGATSEQATRAARSVAEISDEIGFQRDLVDSYNPDDKFRALTQTAGLAALALGGVKDGLAAVGIESEFLDKVIGSAQALLGVTSAIGGISDAYGVLTASQRAASASAVVAAGTTEALAVAETEATVATYSFSTALLANPIVATVAAVVALVAILYTYIKVTGDAEKATAKSVMQNEILIKSLSNLEEQQRRTGEETEFQSARTLALAKAQGRSSDEIRKLTLSLAQQETAEKKLNSAKADALVIAAERALRDSEADEETKKRLKETLEEAIKFSAEQSKILSDSYAKQRQIITDNEIQIVQERTDARLKAEEEAKKAREKALEDAKKKREEDAKNRKELLKSEAQADIDTRKELQSAQDEINKEREEAEKEERERIAAAKVAELEKFADDQKAIEEGMLQQKKDIQNAEISIAERGIQLIASVFGKSKAVQKGAIIAENAIGIGKQVIANNTANAGALATPQAIATSGASAVPVIALNNISTGIGIASTIAATSKALSAVGGGGAGSAGTSGGGAQPSRNVAQVGFQGSSENQISTAIAKQQKAQPPVEAFVVSQSVKDQMELDRKKELNNSF